MFSISHLHGYVFVLWSETRDSLKVDVVPDLVTVGKLEDRNQHVLEPDFWFI